jgi:zinc transport system substrate-binding protein
MKLILSIKKMMLATVCLLLFSVSVAANTEYVSDYPQTLNLKVITSNIPLALISRDVIGNLGRVDSLIKAGQSPHDFALKMSDRKRLAHADLLVWLGANIEPYLLSFADQQARQQLRMDQLFGVVGKDNHHNKDHSKHLHNAQADNSHAWLSPDNALKLATLVVERLIEIKPALKDQLTANLTVFRERLAVVDSQIKQSLAVISEQPYGAVHGAYSAFTEYYGLSKPFMISLSTERPPGIKRLLSLRKELTKGSCVLVEPEHAQGWPKQLTAREGLKLKQIDTLAGSRDYPTYVAWLQKFASDFSLCLQS